VRLVFCGTPEFAVPTLQAVLAAGHEVSLVLTQPDRPSGRGMQPVTPPVKVAAMRAALKVDQPEKIKSNADLRARLEAIAPDAIVVIAYGRLIPAWMLALPRLGCINVHGSLLPKYRGAAPIQWAIARGETVTGVTTMLLNEGLDTGPMLLQRELAIGPDQTAADLYPPLAQMGAELLVETLAGLAAGTIVPVAQEDALATRAPILTREDGRIDFTRSAEEIYDRWRGFYPWPGAWTMLQGKKFGVTRMSLNPHLKREMWGTQIRVGELVLEGGRLYAACGEREFIELVEIQLEGKRAMPAAEFLRGHALLPGAVLGA
jgi:methionyl-tRNA formyltransferase